MQQVNLPMLQYSVAGLYLLLLFYLNNNDMGTSEHTKPVNTLNFYSAQFHSIQGPVSVFRLHGEQLFIFEKHRTPTSIMKVAQLVKKQQVDSLVTCYGNLEGAEKVGLGVDCACDARERQFSTYWVYNNRTLRDQIRHNSANSTHPTEDRLWKCLQGLAQATECLFRHGIFVDCSLDNVQMSPLKMIQLYWGHARCGNAHRRYYLRLLGDPCMEEPMAPEELTALKRNKMTAKNDLTKCVLFTIGVVTLLYATNVETELALFDFKTHELRRGSLKKLLEIASRHYSQRLVNIMVHLLQENPAHRISLPELLAVLREPSAASISLTPISTPKGSARGQKIDGETSSGGSKMSVRQFAH